MSDLIDRQAAIDAIDEYIENNRRPDFIGNMVWVSGVADAMRIVSDLPSVQERKGRWNRISPAKIYECSKCGKNVMTDDIEAYTFCHGCGAKMEGAEDEQSKMD